MTGISQQRHITVPSHPAEVLYDILHVVRVLLRQLAQLKILVNVLPENNRPTNTNTIAHCD